MGFVRELDADLLFTSYVLGSQGFAFDEIFVFSVENDLSTKVSCSGADFDNSVGCGDESVVVFDDDNGVSHGLEFADGNYHSVDFGAVESDGGFVEDIDDTCEFVSELFSKAETLHFTTGEGFDTTREVDVAESEVVDGFDSIHEWFHNSVDEFGRFSGFFSVCFEENFQVGEGLGLEVGDVEAR